MDLGPRVRFRAKSGTQGSSSPLEIGLALLGFTIATPRGCPARPLARSLRTSPHG